MNLRFEVLTETSPTLLSDLLAMIKNGFQQDAESIYFLVVFIKFGKIFVAYDGPAPVAVIQTLQVWGDPNVVHIASTVTHKEYQGQDIGERLMHFMIDYVVQAKFKAIGIHIAPWNKAGLSLYQRKLGFQIIGEHPDYYGEGEHRLYLRKDVTEVAIQPH